MESKELSNVTSSEKAKWLELAKAAETKQELQLAYMMLLPTHLEGLVQGDDRDQVGASDPVSVLWKKGVVQWLLYR